MLWDIGIELGETAVRMATREKGLAFAAPSWGAARKGALIAIGDEARQMLGRTPPGVTLSRPLEHGSIADARLTAQWLTRLLEPFVGGAKVNRPSVVFLDGGRLAPGEREMLIDTARELGAGTCGFLEEAVAAAAGAGLDVSRPEGRAVLDAGAGRMSASLVARGRVVLAKGLSYGFDRMNEDIVQLVRAETGLRIGFQAAEELKLVLGSALPAREVTATAVGLDMKNGFPGEREISAVQIKRAVDPLVDALALLINGLIGDAPEELSADLLKGGLILTGGGALLSGLDAVLDERCGLPCHRPETPGMCTFKGMARVLQDKKLADLTVRAV